VDKIRQRWAISLLNVIFVGRKSGRVKQLDLRQPLVVVAALALVFGIVGGAFSIGMSLGEGHRSSNPLDQLGGWSAELGAPEIADRRPASGIAGQGQCARDAGRPDERERDPARCAGPPPDADGESGRRGIRLQQTAAAGRRRDRGGSAGADPQLTAMVDELQGQLSSREQQLGVLENLILTRELNKQVYRKAAGGGGLDFVLFGRRPDPFTGYTVVHKGVDFAAPRGPEYPPWRRGW